MTRNKNKIYEQLQTNYKPTKGLQSKAKNSNKTSALGTVHLYNLGYIGGLLLGYFCIYGAKFLKNDKKNNLVASETKIYLK